MTPNRLPILFLLGLAIAGCGGGGPKPPQTPTPPPAAAEVQVAISSPAVNAELGQGDLFRATLAGTWTARNLGSSQVYLQVTDSGNTFVLPEAQLAPAGGGFSYLLPLATTVGVGPRSGSLAIRACRDATCAQPYEGASASLAYQLRVSAVPEWETEQGNAAHNGYVPITLDPARFATAWSWSPARRVFSVVTSPGAVHVEPYAQEFRDVLWTNTIHTLDAATGAERWRVTVADGKINTGQGITQEEGLGIAFGRLYYQLNFANDGLNVRSLGIDDGKPAVSMFWQDGTSREGPVGHGDSVFVARSYATRAYDRDGRMRWEAEGGFNKRLAVDDAHVYRNGFGLQILDRATGAALAYIPDPVSPGSVSFSPPILGGSGNLVAFVGPMPDRLQPTYRRRLASLDIATLAWSWMSAETYFGTPAVANGVIYAWRAGPIVLDAIDEATGTVLWTWRPDVRQDFYSLPNLVVTRNVLFAGTETRTYALDLASRNVVFEIPISGALAISAGRMLYIGGTAGLTAVRLQ